MKKHIQQSKLTTFIAIAVMSMCTISCSRTIYVQSDSMGTSKFILFKENYKYLEKTNSTSFKTSGRYYTTDSTIVFELRETEKIPYNYCYNNAVKLSKSTTSRIQILIVDKYSRDPMPFATIRAKNKYGEDIFNTDTDFDGKAFIDKNNKIETLEIQYPGYTKHLIDYKAYKNYNLKIEMDDLKPGGRMSGGCIITFIDKLLEYKINNKSRIDEFTKNEVIFQREQKRSKTSNKDH